MGIAVVMSSVAIGVASAQEGERPRTPRPDAIEEAFERPDREEREAIEALHERRRQDVEDFSPEIQLLLLKLRKQRREAGLRPEDVARRYFARERSERLAILREETERWARFAAADDSEKTRMIDEEARTEPRIPPPRRPGRARR